MKETMQRIMFKVIPNCREAMELQSRALDEKLGFGKRLLLKMHLFICKICRRYGKQLECVRDITRESTEKAQFERAQPMPEEVRARILENLKNCGSEKE